MGEAAASATTDAPAAVKASGTAVNPIVKSDPSDEESGSTKLGDHFLLQPCRNTAAFELIPRRKGAELDLERSQKTLLDLGFKLVTDARVLLILERECVINLWPSGRVLIRTMDQALAQRLASSLVTKLFPGT